MITTTRTTRVLLRAGCLYSTICRWSHEVCENLVKPFLKLISSYRVLVSFSWRFVSKIKIPTTHDLHVLIEAWCINRRFTVVNSNIFHPSENILNFQGIVWKEGVLNKSDLQGWWLFKIDSYCAIFSFRYLATSKFEPVDARRAFPCFDEPNIKATYTVHLVHQDGYTALSNMPEVVRETY